MKISGFIYKELVEIRWMVIFLIFISPLIHILINFDLMELYKLNPKILLGEETLFIKFDGDFIRKYFEIFTLKRVNILIRDSLLSIFSIISYSILYVSNFTHEFTTNKIKTYLKLPIERWRYLIFKHIFFNLMIYSILLGDGFIISYLLYGYISPYITLLVIKYFPYIFLITSIALFITITFSNELATLIIPYILFQIIYVSISPVIFSYDQYSLIKGIDPYFFLGLIDDVEDLFGNSSTYNFLINIDRDFIGDAIRYYTLLYIFLTGVSIFLIILSIFVFLRRDLD